jgi:IS5 family transposase
MEDLSDREMERYLQENLACKWLCYINLRERAPDHSYFGDFRAGLGTRRLMDIFSQVQNSLRGIGLIREIFTFVDASQLISKLTTWDDWDRTIKQGLEQFNNKTVGKVAADKQARFGCKGKKQILVWLKEHISVDMQSGLINKIAATSAEVTDTQGFRHVCPNGGAVYAEKGYDLNPVKTTLKKKGCHNAILKKNNMKKKIPKIDRWLSAIRAPHERVFAHRNKKVRYRGLVKVQFQVGIRALVFNLKRLMTVRIDRITLCHT